MGERKRRSALQSARADGTVSDKKMLPPERFSKSLQRGFDRLEFEWEDCPGKGHQDLSAEEMVSYL